MPETRAVMTFHHLGDPIPLSRRVPLLENFGFSVVNERTYRIARKDGLPLYRHDMTLVARRRRARSTSAPAQRLHDAVLAVWRDKAENDGFNALVLARRASLAPRRAASHHRALSAADDDSLFDRLSVGRAPPLSGDRGAPRRAFRGALRARTSRRASASEQRLDKAHRGRARQACRASTTTRSCAPSAR